MSTEELDLHSYDRAAAAQVLAEVLADAQLQIEGRLSAGRQVEPEFMPMVAAAGSHLTRTQLSYLESRMHPCPVELVTSASHQVLWKDSDDVMNVAHCGPGRLGAVVPIVARETVLVLRRAVADDPGVRAATQRLTAAQWATMAATTTDRDPVEIFNVGLETTARALVQHAYLADRTPYWSAADFARGLRDSGVFAVVANTWFWGLQSSTFRAE